MTDELQELLDAAKIAVVTPEQEEAQRRCFVFRNTNIGNPHITREIVDREADAMVHAEPSS